MKKSKRQLTQTIASLMAITFIVLNSANIAMARLGGGGGYSGGGGGGGFGGGSFGGGGGDGESIVQLIVFLTKHPIVGIPVLIVVVLFLLGAGYESIQSNQRRVIRKGHRQQKAIDLENKLKLLQQRDPDFDVDVFMDRIRAAFPRLQQGWCHLDLGPNRLFLSDAVYERFNLQMQRMQSKGIRDHMENIKILNMDVAQLQSDAVFDTLTLRITASAIDYQVAIDSEKYVRGNKRAERFTEYWSFIRRPGAQTKAGLGLIEGSCPNCGDSLKMNEATQCPSCQSLIKSGEYDWVLAEITQACEWHLQELVEIPGVSALRQSDPGFSLQHVEDRTSVMFWRAMEAYRLGSVAPLLKMCSQACSRQFEQSALNPQSDGTRIMPDDIAVGAVDTLGVVLTPEWDYVLIQIRWSAQNKIVDRKGKIRDSSGGLGIRNHVYILKRQHGIQSNLSLALTSAHCSGCGGPLADSQSSHCAYCGVVLNSPATDWILDGIELPYHERIRSLRELFGNIPVPKDDTAQDMDAPIQACAWLINVAVADGQISSKERKLLFKYGKNYGVSSQRMEKWLEQAMTAGQLETHSPSSRQDAKHWLQSMVHMALIDGKMSRSEYRLLLAIGQKLEFSAYDIKSLITRTQKALYKKARQNLRKATPSH